MAGATIDYDLSGNLKTDGVWNYTYDIENMLLTAAKPGVWASYIYDPLGRRAAKSVNGQLTSFLHDGVEEIGDYNSSGALLRRYVHGPGVDEYLVMYTGLGTSSKSWFHANHQGSIVAMSDAAGNVTEQHSYDSYGNSADLTGNPFRYTGRRLDEETGLYYYRARYMSPRLGRFLQTDPIGYGDGLNMYAYVGNDPVNNNDPSGNDRCGLACMERKGLNVSAERKARHAVIWEGQRKNLIMANKVGFAILTLPFAAEYATANILGRLAMTARSEAMLITSFQGAVVSGGSTAMTGGDYKETTMATIGGSLTGGKVGMVDSALFKAYFGAQGAALTTAFTGLVTGETPSVTNFVVSVLAGATTAQKGMPLTGTTAVTAVDSAINNTSPARETEAEENTGDLDVEVSSCEGTRIGNVGSGSIC